MTLKHNPRMNIERFCVMFRKAFGFDVRWNLIPNRNDLISFHFGDREFTLEESEWISSNYKTP
jgi:hypothetical protein